MTYEIKFKGLAGTLEVEADYLGKEDGVAVLKRDRSNRVGGSGDIVAIIPLENTTCIREKS